MRTREETSSYAVVVEEKEKTPEDRAADGREASATAEFEPPDGGWGWVVCAASFWTNGTLFGVMNCFGVLYVDMYQFAEDHKDAAFLTSLVGSVCIGTTFLLSMLSSVMTDRIGIRKTSLLGGIFASVGMLLSSFMMKIELLCLTYGVIFGIGASLAYTPSLVILGHYFKKRLGLINGIVTAGSSTFTMILPLVLTWLLKTVGIQHTLQVLAALMTTLVICSLTFKSNPIAVPPTQTTKEAHKLKGGLLSNLINKNIWRNKRYVLWVTAIPIALFGYFVPYVHLVKHVKDIMPEQNGELLVTCIGLTSGIGRVIFGKVADFPRVNRIMLQQISFFSIGLLTIVLVFANNFPLLIGICLLMGLFDGCFISLLGPIAFDIVGQSGASQAIGFLLGFCSLPLTIGPPVAGLLYDKLGNYTVAFLIAGVPPIFASLLMFLIHKFGKEEIVCDAQESPAKSAVAAETTLLVSGQNPHDVIVKSYSVLSKNEKTGSSAEVNLL